MAFSLSNAREGISRLTGAFEGRSSRSESTLAIDFAPQRSPGERVASTLERMTAKNGKEARWVRTIMAAETGPATFHQRRPQRLLRRRKERIHHQAP